MGISKVTCHGRATSYSYIQEEYDDEDNVISTFTTREIGTFENVMSVGSVTGITTAVIEILVSPNGFPATGSLSFGASRTDIFGERLTARLTLNGINMPIWPRTTFHKGLDGASVISQANGWKPPSAIEATDPLYISISTATTNTTQTTPPLTAFTGEDAAAAVPVPPALSNIAITATANQLARPFKDIDELDFTAGLGGQYADSNYHVIAANRSERLYRITSQTGSTTESTTSLLKPQLIAFTGSTRSAHEACGGFVDVGPQSFSSDYGHYYPDSRLIYLHTTLNNAL